MRSDWLLFFHVASAMLLVGGVLTVVTVSLAAARSRRPEQLPLLRAIAFRANLAVVLPSFVAVRVLGSTLSDREFESHEPEWLSISVSLTDISLLVGGVGLTALQFWVLRRTRAGRPGGWPSQLADYLPVLVFAVLVTVIVLMAGKPVS